MLSRALSTWGRLFGRGRGATTEEERRGWVRFPCLTPTAVTTPGGGERLEVEVQNISRGGANLLATRSFRPGVLLRVDLPGAGETSSTVLACVLRCENEGEGRWSLGCSFSSELSPDDLALFAGEPLGPAEESALEQRT